MLDRKNIFNNSLSSFANSGYIKLAIISILSLSIPSCDIDNNDEKMENTIETQNIINNKKENIALQQENFDVYKINKNAEDFLEEENYDLALEEFIIILKHYTELKDTLGLIETYSKIGNIHYEQDLYEKSLTAFNQSLKLSTKLNNKLRQIKNYNNIAKSFYYENNIPLSSTAYNEALNIFNDGKTKTQNKDVLRELVKTYEGLAWIFHKSGDTKKLQEYMNFALEYSKQSGDEELKVAMILNISDIKYTIGDINGALNYLISNQEKIESLNIGYYKEILYRDMSYFYEKLGNYKKSLEYKNKEITIKDQRKNSESERIQADMEAKWEAGEKDKEIKQKEAEIQAKAAEVKIADERAQKETRTKWGLLTILGMGALGGIWGFRQYKKIKKQTQIAEKAKEEAEEQKQIAEQKTEEVASVNDELMNKNNIIEKQNKHIEFAVEAAKNQQKNRLPSQLSINKIFLENMILYKPKDKVSGDFYFVEQIGDIKIFATLDSTGHGIEGAMTSVAGLTSLRNSFKQGIIEPKGFVNRLNTSIYDGTGKEDGGTPAKYTMEGSVISYNEKTGEMNLSGSKGEIFIFPNNTDHNISEGKDKNGFIIKKFKTKEGNAFYSLGTQKEFLGDTEKSNFKNFSINIDNAKIIMFSDGYQDQFGGKKGKKLKKANFRNILSAAVTDGIDLGDTQRILEEHLKNRIGNNEQVDDITVTGIKLEKKSGI